MRKLCSLPEADDVWHVVCASPQLVLLTAAVNHRAKELLVSGVQKTDPFRRVDFVPRCRQEVDTRQVYINVCTAVCLNAIRME